jgi:hypothetical protein
LGACSLDNLTDPVRREGSANNGPFKSTSIITISKGRISLARSASVRHRFGGWCYFLAASVESRSAVVG